MQLIHSELSKNEYLSFLKGSFSSPLNFYTERFVGFCIGKFFYVIHHCEHQWDRKYNSPKNAAIGYVTNCDDGCDITFFTLKGLFCPSQFLLLLSSIILFPIVASILHSGMLTLYTQPAFWILSILFIFLGAGVECLFESMTERSLEGENQLLSLLYDPQNPY